jgi:DnaK suppressor protein
VDFALPAMNTDDLNRFRGLLEEQLESLRSTNASHQQQLDESHAIPDFAGGDRAAELESLEVDESVVASEANLMEKIIHALERLDEGSYGVCEACKQPIPLPRLEAKPSVSLCVACQEAHEGGG